MSNEAYLKQFTIKSLIANCYNNYLSNYLSLNVCIYIQQRLLCCDV